MRQINPERCRSAFVGIMPSYHLSAVCAKDVVEGQASTRAGAIANVRSFSCGFGHLHIYSMQVAAS